MNIAFIGCGYVADLYIQTLRLHPKLKLVGVYDRQPSRTRNFAEHHGVRGYAEYDELLNDLAVDVVLNLTNPSSHYEVTRAALEAGKHVYSEKPLAMTVDDARKLVDLAERRGLHLSGAPCSVLSETAQTMWKAVRDDRVGPIRLVYAEMEDGMLHKMAYKKWLSESGIPWPYRDEFEVGCTLEHAGYCVTWLAAMFGPAKTVTAFSSVLIPDKCRGEPLDSAPDFSVAAIRFANGTVARLTCSIIAPHDHVMRLIGDDGILSVKDCWFYQAPVYEKKWLTIRRRTMLSPIPRKIKPLGLDVMPRLARRGAAQMDFLRGVAELADAIAEDRPSRLAPDFSLHICELALAISNAHDGPTSYQMTTTFEPMQPMLWASDDAKPVERQSNRIVAMVTPTPSAYTKRERSACFGIIGAGRMAREFVEDLKQTEGSSVVAVMSQTPANAQRLAETFGIARVHESIEAFCADPGIDVVYIATPPASHHPLAMAALRGGKAVICEKPFALNEPQAREMIELAREKKLFCMEAMWTRFLPAMQRIRRALDRGEIGETRLFQADFSIPVKPDAGHFLFSAEAGGGVILDRLVYAVSMAHDLWGEPDDLHAAIQESEHGVDESVSVILKWQSGRMANLSASFGAYGSNEVVIAGSRGRLRIAEPICRPETISLKSISMSPPDDHAPGGGKLLAKVKRRWWARRGINLIKRMRQAMRAENLPVMGHGYSHEIQEVVRCLRDGVTESPRMPLDQTLAVMRTLDRIRRRAM